MPVDEISPMNVWFTLIDPVREWLHRTYPGITAAHTAWTIPTSSGLPHCKCGTVILSDNTEELITGRAFRRHVAEFIAAEIMHEKETAA